MEKLKNIREIVMDGIIVNKANELRKQLVDRLNELITRTNKVICNNYMFSNVLDDRLNSYYKLVKSRERICSLELDDFIKLDIQEEINNIFNGDKLIMNELYSTLYLNA
jgi:hypothetical protein